MHILGTVFAWLAAVVTIVAIVLTTMLLDVRTKWLDQVVQKQEQVEKSIADLDSAEIQVRQLEEELQRATLYWGDVWTAPDSQGPVPGSPGLISVNVGTSKGFSQDAEALGKDIKNATYFVFNTNNAGESQYLGEFRVDDLTAGQAGMRLARRPYAGEVETWAPGNYRIRDLMPGNWMATTANLEGEWLIANTKKRSQELQLDILNKEIQASQRALDQRLAELNGDAAAPPEASQELLDGLVQTLRNLEKERNFQLAQVDQNRRNLDNTYVDLEETLQSNEEVVKELKYLAEKGQREMADEQSVSATSN